MGEQYNNNKGDGQQRHSSRSRKHSSLDEFDLDLTGLKETMGKITVPNTYPELFQERKMGLFADKGNGWKLLTIFTKNSILDVWQGYQYPSDL